MHLTAK